MSAHDPRPIRDRFDTEVKMPNSEIAIEAGMLHGVDAYNEVMGYDTHGPEPCGHQCHSDCPRCGCDLDGSEADDIFAAEEVTR